MPLQEQDLARIDPGNMKEVLRFLDSYVNVLREMREMGYELTEDMLLNFDEVGVAGRHHKTKTKYGYVSKEAAGAFYVGAQPDTGHITLCLLVSAGMVPGGGLLISRRPVVEDAVEGLPPEYKLAWHCLGRIGWTAAVTPTTSSMTKTTLRVWLPDALRQYRVRAGLGADTPLLVMCDGHASRYDIELWRMLKNMRVFMLLLPAHLSHVFQVVDVALAQPLKNGSVGRPLDMSAFNARHEAVSLSRVLRRLVEISVNFERAMQGWESAGLYPLNMSCIDGRGFLDQLNDRQAAKIRQCTGNLVAQEAEIKRMYRLNPYPVDADQLKMRSLGGMCVTHNQEVAELVIEAAERVRQNCARASDKAKTRIVGRWLLGDEEPDGAAAAGTPDATDDEDDEEAAVDAPVLGRELVPASSAARQLLRLRGRQPKNPPSGSTALRKGG